MGFPDESKPVLCVRVFDFVHNPLVPVSWKFLKFTEVSILVANQIPLLLLFCLMFLLSTQFGCLVDFGTVLFFFAPEIFHLNCRQQQQQQQPPPCVLISYEELKAVTKNFHHGNKIGEGIFGTVYKVHSPRKKLWRSTIMQYPTTLADTTLIYYFQKCLKFQILFFQIKEVVKEKIVFVEMKISKLN